MPEGSTVALILNNVCPAVSDHSPRCAAFTPRAFCLATIAVTSTLPIILCTYLSGALRTNG